MFCMAAHFYSVRCHGLMGRPRWFTTVFFRLQSILKPTTMNWDFFKSNIYHIVKWYECKIEGICPCCPCNMVNMLDMPFTFSTCFYPVSRTDEHGRKQIILEYILQWGPLRVPHDRWIKTKFKFFQFFPDFGWFSRFLRFFTLAHLTAAKCSIRMIPDSFRSIRTRDWRTSRTTPVAGAGLLYSWILINEI